MYDLGGIMGVRSPVIGSSGHQVAFGSWAKLRGDDVSIGSRGDVNGEWVDGGREPGRGWQGAGREAVMA
jgi:hypothetical protein